ncbi:MAG: peptidylprolyl isomerase [Bacteroidales bacterium]
MAVLQTIRVRLGVLITVLIAVALLAFIVDPNQLDMTIRSLSGANDVGEIDGNSISYQEFQKDVEYYKNIYTLTSGSQSVSEKAMDQIVNTAWQNRINEDFIIPLMKESGIDVGKGEIYDMTQGKEISPILQQDPAFQDQNGQYSRAKFAQFIQAISSQGADVNGATYWKFIETNMISNQYFTKYSSLLTSSSFVTPIEVRRDIEENNVTSNVDFVMIPVGFNKDITVSNQEINSYYHKHKENYKRTASRDIDFVAYEVIPSEKDFQDANKEIESIYPKFEKAKNLKNFLSLNSDTPLNPYYFSANELQQGQEELYNFAFKTRHPNCLAVYKKDDRYIAARINDVKYMSDSVFVQHIMLSADNEKQADSLLRVVNAKNFSSLAQKYSLDKNTKVDNFGDIGWLTQKMMIPGMEDVLTYKLGSIHKMKTQYGLHIVRVAKKTKTVKKIQLALLTKAVVSSKATYQTYYAQANDLVTKSNGKIELFNKAVEDGNLPVVPANNVKEGARKISMYEKTLEVSRWIYKAKEGDVSPIISINNQYFFVCALKKIKEEGYAPVEDVKDNIKFVLMAKKRADKKLEEVKAKIKGLNTLDEIAEAYNTTVSNKDGMAFGSINNRTFDPNLVGAVAAAEPGTITGPIKGIAAIYILKVNTRNTGAFYTENDAITRESQFQRYQLSNLPYVFNELGEVIDHRTKFY